MSCCSHACLVSASSAPLHVILGEPVVLLLSPSGLDSAFSLCGVLSAAGRGLAPNGRTLSWGGGGGGGGARA